MRTRIRQTKQEARRFAHRLASEAILHIDTTVYGLDRSHITIALAALAEQHMRYGPKSTDRAPNTQIPHATPLLDAMEDANAL